MIRTISNAFGMLKGEQRAFGLSAVTSIATSLTFVIYIDAIRQLIRAVVASDYTGVIRCLLLATVALIAETTAGSALIINRRWLNCAVLTNLRSTFFRKVNRLQLPDLERYRQSDLTTRFLDDLTAIADFFSKELVDAVTNLAVILALCGYVVFHEWRLILVVFIALPVVLWTTTRHGRRLQEASREVQQGMSELNTVAKDIVDHPLEVQAVGAIPFFTRRYAISEKKLVASDERRIYHRTAIWVSNISLYHLIFLFFYGAGALLALRGRVEFGLIIGLYLMIDRLVDTLMGFPAVFTAAHELKPKLERVSEILCSPEEGEKRSDAGPHQDGHAPIIVDDLIYAYNPSCAVLDGVTFTIGRGERVAIVGESGCGKTTLLKLLTAYDDHYHGRLMVLGREMRNWSPRQLRRSVAYCPQQPFLMEKSILANFQSYFGDISLNDLRSYARLVELDCEIEAMECQYETSLAPGGSNLSGGQRQRMGLMLGLMKRSDLLLIDEGLSAVDPQMAGRILDNIAEQIQSTIIVVTHRIQESMMVRFDRIVVMDEGDVVGIGRHHELTDHPVYRVLHERACRERTIEK